MLTGKFFSLFASGPEQVAYWINVMSALLSAFLYPVLVLEHHAFGA